jgi:hypothetical protein
VAAVFEAMKKDPRAILSSSLFHTQLRMFRASSEAVASSAATGVVLGFALAYCMKYPEVSDMMKSFLNDKSKERGENVVGFLQARAKLK